MSGVWVSHQFPAVCFGVSRPSGSKATKYRVSMRGFYIRNRNYGFGQYPALQTQIILASVTQILNTNLKSKGSTYRVRTPEYGGSIGPEHYTRDGIWSLHNQVWMYTWTLRGRHQYSLPSPEAFKRPTTSILPAWLQCNPPYTPRGWLWYPPPKASWVLLGATGRFAPTHLSTFLHALVMGTFSDSAGLCSICHAWYMEWVHTNLELTSKYTPPTSGVHLKTIVRLLLAN